MVREMSVWAWLAIGTGAFFGIALVVGFGIATILGRISQDVTDLLEAEVWCAAPLTRALEAPPDVPATAPASGRESLRSSD